MLPSFFQPGRTLATAMRHVVDFKFEHGVPVFLTYPAELAPEVHASLRLGLRVKRSAPHDRPRLCQEGLSPRHVVVKTPTNRIVFDALRQFLVTGSDRSHRLFCV
jgi:hypothetical protein